MNKRILSLLLVALMTLSALSACASSGDPAETTAAPAASTTAAPNETTAPEPEPAYTYADVNYNGETFGILNEADRYNMLYHVMPAELTGEALNDVRFKINQSVAERYNVKLKETQIPYADIFAFAQQEILAQTGEHDVFFEVGTHVGTLTNSGYLLNLMDIDGLNLDQPWWDQSLIEYSTVAEKYLYYASSSYHLVALEGTSSMYFNKKMMKDLSLEYPYQLVRDGKWTQDKLYEYAAAAANLNGAEKFLTTGQYSADSGSAIYGLTAIDNYMTSFVLGSNAFYIIKNEEDMPAIGYNNEHYISVCEKIGKLTSSEGVFVRTNSALEPFSNYRALLLGSEIKAGANELRNMTEEFGILPTPKYDEAQERYISNIFWGADFFTIPITCKDTDRAAIIMDALAYEADANVLPVYYERVCYKGLRDEESIEMLEIIKNTRYYNLGVTYDWIDSIEPSVNQMLREGNGNVATLVKSSTRIVERLIDSTMKKFTENK